MRLRPVAMGLAVSASFGCPGGGPKVEDTSATTAPVPHSPIGDVGVVFISLTLGDGRLCAIAASGQVMCWQSARAELECVQPSMRDASDVTLDFDAPGPCVISGGAREVVCSSWETGEPVLTIPGPFQSIDGVCGVRVDGTIYCWDEFQDCPAVAPSGRFSSLTTRGGAGSAIDEAGAMVLWGPHGCTTLDDMGCFDCPATRTLAGPYTAASAGPLYSGACAARESGGIECFSGDDGPTLLGVGAPLDGLYSDLDVYNFHSSSNGCAIGAGAVPVCWGDDDPPPSRTVSEVEGDRLAGYCSLGLDGTIECWGNPTGVMSWEPCGERE